MPHLLCLFLVLAGVFLPLLQGEPTPETPQQKLLRLEEETKLLQQNLTQKQQEIKLLKNQISPAPAAVATTTPSADPAQKPATPPAEKKPKPSDWKNELSLGASYSEGNTDSVSLQVRGQSIRETKVDKLAFRALVDIREVNDRTASDRGKGEVQYNHQIDEKLYWLTRGAGEYDSVIDLDYRYQVGPGLGYYFYKTEIFEFSLESGPAYEGVQFARAGFQNSILARVADRMRWQIAPNLKFLHSAEFSNDLLETEKYTFTINGSLESTINKMFTLRFTAEDRYNLPPSNIPANRRERNDLLLITSIVWKF